jgi:hypothetical protein
MNTDPELLPYPQTLTIAPSGLWVTHSHVSLMLAKAKPRDPALVAAMAAAWQVRLDEMTMVSLSNRV